MTNLADAVKKKLGIKWVDAKALVERAMESCEIQGDTVPKNREDEVLEEAIELFEDLDEAEQERMRQEANEQPAWKVKALRAAEKREEEFRAKQAAVAQSEMVRDQLRDEGVEEAVVANTKVTAIRKLEEQPMSEEERETRAVVRKTTCYCVIQ